MEPKNPGAFSPGPTAWESNPKRQGGMRTRCPTNPSGDLAPTQDARVGADELSHQPIRGSGAHGGTPGWEQTSCPTSPTGDLAPTQGGAGALEPRCV